MSIETYELVYFTGEAQRRRDFSGRESALELPQRMEFLQKYQQQARQWYQDPELNLPAATCEDTADLLRAMDAPQTRVRQTVSMDTMEAESLYKQPRYRGLHLYCGAYAEGNTLQFPGRKIRPTPCAFYETEEDVTSFSASVYIPRDYKSTQNRRCGTAQGGRIIELRVGTVEKVKIKLCNSGEIFAMTGDMWEPRYQQVAQVRYGAWNDISVSIGETITVTANGQVLQDVPPVAQGAVSGIFFDGSMFPREGWTVRNIQINGKPLVLEENPLYETGETVRLGEVTLPYAIGTRENRDRQLILTKRFTVHMIQEAVLELETLDPCGKVWLNGHLVLDADDFTAHSISITPWLREGENTLKILVEPRAPEVYYYWHRHNDCYHGWFCGAVKLHLTQKEHITGLFIKTLEAAPQVKAQARLTFSTSVHGFVRLYAAKHYPEKGKEQLVAEAGVSGREAVLDFTGSFDLWSDLTPNLYALRAELLDKNGKALDDFAVETGFRTVCQKDGSVLLNSEKIQLRGALLMQFLPPFDRVPVNHICPTAEEIAWQVQMLKNMNGNFLRLHMLGYGTNDARFARICDRLGIMLIWVTRFIDTLEELVWDDGVWHEEQAYLQQICAVRNFPSIILYEGSNEYHPDDLLVIDRMYDRFVDAVTAVDDTRLLTPCSHLYYGGGLYDHGCAYYNDDGTKNEKGSPARSSHGWVHKNVVRSSHTYSLLCGYGESWEAMRKQDWIWQPEMLESNRHSYLVTEFAITALPNPGTPEALETPCVQSYERPDEDSPMGRRFKDDEWMESQALQALCAFNAVKKMRLMGVDGMAWCCLQSGANNGSYMKPPIDFYGYKKLGFYALQHAYRDTFACKADTDVSYGTQDSFQPVVFCRQAGVYDLTVDILAEDGKSVCSVQYPALALKAGHQTLEAMHPAWQEKGYYTLRFSLEKRP